VPEITFPIWIKCVARRLIADPNTPVLVGVMGPSGPVFSNTVADDTGNWSVDFSGIFDIFVGSSAWVETSDSDGDFGYQVAIRIWHSDETGGDAKP
jgi:hypothetical protein